MVTVSQAEQIILAKTGQYGTEKVPFNDALGRVLAEDIHADRDLPPCNRVTMDGIAIRYDAFEQGARSFRIRGVIAAGDVPIEIGSDDECVEIMTGGALPASADTVVRYEDTDIVNGTAVIKVDAVRKGQNIHTKGKDRRPGDVVVTSGQYVDAATVSMAASVGQSELQVAKLPRVVVISTGDELVDVKEKPTPYQVRHSNNHTIQAVLRQHCIDADLLHIPDSEEQTRAKLGGCLERYDVVIMTGGVSMGKFDYVPPVLDELKVARHFHKVQQRPGKPFWFGSIEGGVKVFAFPGNPVSAFMCLHRYFIPWLEASLGLKPGRGTECYATLDADINFAAELQYFAQVKLHMSRQGQLLATPVEGHGSGDFANLLDSDAFIELPLEQNIFKKGEAYRIWPFKKLIA